MLSRSTLSNMTNVCLIFILLLEAEKLHYFSKTTCKLMEYHLCNEHKIFYFTVKTMTKFNLWRSTYCFYWCKWTSAQLCQDAVSTHKHCKADYLLDIWEICRLKQQAILHSSIHCAGWELIGKLAQCVRSLSGTKKVSNFVVAVDLLFWSCMGLLMQIALLTNCLFCQSVQNTNNPTF